MLQTFFFIDKIDCTLQLTFCLNLGSFHREKPVLAVVIAVHPAHGVPHVVKDAVVVEFNVVNLLLASTAVRAVANLLVHVFHVVDGPRVHRVVEHVLIAVSTGKNRRCRLHAAEISVGITLAGSRIEHVVRAQLKVRIRLAFGYVKLAAISFVRLDGASLAVRRSFVHLDVSSIVSIAFDIIFGHTPKKIITLNLYNSYSIAKT